MNFTSMLTGALAHPLAEVAACKSALFPLRASQDALHHVLSAVSLTSFGREHGLWPHMTIDEFRLAVPIRGYSDLLPWLERVWHNEDDVLVPGRPWRYATTSGTTTTPKRIPITRQFLNDYHFSSHLTFHRVVFNQPRAAVGGILAIGGPSWEGVFQGIPVASITGLLYETLPPMLRSRLAVPPFIHNIPDPVQRWYAIARLSLQARVSGLITISPAALFVLSDTINEQSEELIDEIAAGTSRSLDGLKESERTIFTRLCGTPSPLRAQQLSLHLKRKGSLLPADIWNMHALCTYTKGLSGSVRSRFEREFGDPLTIDTGLVATEGRVSVGLRANEECSGVIPLRAFVEFARVDLRTPTIASDARTSLPHELESGELYTPVLTSTNGLLRYHLGDVVRTRHDGAIPSIEFVGRMDGSLSAVGEKMTDVHVRTALESLGLLDDPYSLWTTSVDWDGKAFHYVIWLETHSDIPPAALDHVLQDVNLSYSRKRKQRLLGEVQLRRLPANAASDTAHSGRVGQEKFKRLWPIGTSPDSSQGRTIGR